MPPIVVFLGPTLPAAKAPGCIVLPPARQGDVFRAVRDHRPRAIGLIDGVFQDAPAVWHRELLWAMDQGVRVLGAASMGALRAAELDRFGMVGLGAIYHGFRDGCFAGFAPFEDDDEVAVIHAPAEAGGAALSDAMVDLRATLRRGEELGFGPAAPAAAQMKALPFARRSFAALAGVAGEWVHRHAVRQKAADARALLAALAALPDTPFEAPFAFTRALVWERFVASQAVLPARLAALDPAAFERVRRAAVGRLAAVASLPRAPAMTVRAERDRFRVGRGLLMQRDIAAFLGQNEIIPSALEAALAHEAAIAAAPASPELFAMMLEVLALS